MRLEETRKLRPGMRVKCPGDGDSPARTAVVVELCEPAQVDLFGEEFLWVLVRDPQRGAAELASSNVLSLDIAPAISPGAAGTPAPVPPDARMPSLF